MKTTGCRISDQSHAGIERAEVARSREHFHFSTTTGLPVECLDRVGACRQRNRPNTRSRSVIRIIHHDIHPGDPNASAVVRVHAECPRSSRWDNDRSRCQDRVVVSTASGENLITSGKLPITTRVEKVKNLRDDRRIRNNAASSQERFRGRDAIDRTAAVDIANREARHFQAEPQPGVSGAPVRGRETRLGP